MEEFLHLNDLSDNTHIPAGLREDGRGRHNCNILLVLTFLYYKRLCLLHRHANIDLEKKKCHCAHGDHVRSWSAVFPPQNGDDL